MRDPDTCQGKTAQQEDYDSGISLLMMVLYSLVLSGGVLWAIWYSF